jgi:hypothetical protein
MTDEAGEKPDNAGKKQDGRFKEGQSGNPCGMRRGSRHRATLAAEKLLDGEAQELTRKCIDLAKNGDTTALRLCLERLIPPRKDRPIVFGLPAFSSASDAASAMSGLLQAVAGGAVTPSEASNVGRLIEGYVKALELTEFEKRLAALEQVKP